MCAGCRMIPESYSALLLMYRQSYPIIESFTEENVFVWRLAMLPTTAAERSLVLFQQCLEARVVAEGVVDRVAPNTFDLHT